MPAQLCALEDDALLHLNGTGVPAFLQGQLSCDLRELSVDRSTAGALCNVRGRVEADLRVLMWSAEHCALRVSAALVDHVQAVLGKYAMFSRIALDSREPRWQPWACWGGDAAALVEQLCGSRVSAEHGCARAPGLIACQADREASAFELYLERESEAGEAALQQLQQHTEAGIPCSWRALELRRGLFRLPPGEQDRHVPQALNYDLSGLISFKKGCYTGQEVVARLHYRGKAKRRAALYALPADTAPPEAETIVLGEAGARGTVLRALACPGAPTLVLTLIDAAAGAAPAHLELPGQPMLEPLALPYLQTPEG